jgi:glycosyltransferase involved in cell wall biosynthesis
LKALKKNSNILIFHLSRKGCADYAAGMINHLPQANCIVFVSQYSRLEIQKKSIPVRTYRNLSEFIISTIFYLPLLLVKIVVLNNKNPVTAAYFPAFHHWNLPLLWVCKKLRIKTIYTVHDGIPHEGERDWFTYFIQNKNIKLASGLIFLTEYVQENTGTTIPSTTKSKIIPHPIIEYPGLKTERSFPESPKLLFLGRIEKYKGVERLIEAVRKLPNNAISHLTIAGKSGYDFINPRDPKITIIDKWLSTEEITELFVSHDILVLPYSSATQSGIVTLGISAAIPMICTKKGGLPEQLTDDEAVWTDADADSLLEGILLLTRSKEMYDRIHHKLKMKRNTNSWKNAALQLAEILKC